MFTSLIQLKNHEICYHYKENIESTCGVLFAEYHVIQFVLQYLITTLKAILHKQQRRQ